MAKLPEIDTNAHNKISVGTTIVGDIQSNGDIRFDGTLNGNISTKGKIVIGESGKVVGEMTCKNADIEGRVEGKVSVAELLTLKSTAVVKGDIVVSKLAIEPGAKFTGNCNMTGDTNVFGAAKQEGKLQEEPGKVK